MGSFTHVPCVPQKQFPSHISVCSKQGLNDVIGAMLLCTSGDVTVQKKKNVKCYRGRTSVMLVSYFINVCCI